MTVCQSVVKNGLACGREAQTWRSCSRMMLVALMLVILNASRVLHLTMLQSKTESTFNEFPIFLAYLIIFRP